MGHNRDESDGNRELKKPVIIVGNKADIEGSLDYFQMLELELAEEWPVSLVSAEEEVGFDPEPSVPLSAIGGLLSLARIHRRTPMDGVRTAEGGG